ncbi:MAG: tRNA pseudouridine(38-40) synthase TruA [Gammaproteobacteria bacterium]|uniref:tRNA pseudouridine(38-40) synthase TruA n=1 Tax=unclassified Marinomonas TaxID=196814 RepID=UPI000C1F0487|nr:MULTISPECIES: tRNA pseudouridine(38-40) synthase TruA [unclassified Marinomonas]MBU1297295.1 tRNA pseudouridine(38-40) synthase TruA [Gammaproteobacteria bacterium]MBU1468059.1 tRNA pseudouridine(38-40) synthase TruA [Gammaproteobacteria bacterium]MBU2024163.1 tRNA pseudouridine(38-40) synthase TruA [Gammaproteobacteria bacterium]MBU2240801.1 tRNA pseudouridine(38-40) synthase TruA [Gammaproteobacteria bacterium]MBU2318437.1 tRNA pseudouridine(38-40) synthase TruA [Gammaproteobacteria bacte
MTKKVVLVVEYNGSEYKGWQAQKFGVPSVQENLEKALAIIANHPVKVVCAGRTDSGVHASAQVVHFETDVERSERAWTIGVNTYLPTDITVVAASSVSDDFHARFSALSRRYRYVIYSSAFCPAILAKGVTWTYKTLDVAAMEAAAKVFLGTHDFSSFRAIGCQANTPIRTILNFDVQQLGQYIVLDVRANAFLHHMIRNFAGVLMSIGAGEKPVSWARQTLEAKDRTKGGITAPPTGLYFVDAQYPDVFNVPKRPLGPHFLPYVDEPVYELPS